MAKEESYEIMPYKEIVALKKEIEELKRKTGDTSSQELINSMAKLTKNMDDMLALFQAVAEEMKTEESTEEKMAKNIGPLLEKLNDVVEQNKTIAEGLVTIADMIKEQPRQPLPAVKPPRKAHPEMGELPPLAPPPSFQYPMGAPMGAPMPLPRAAPLRRMPPPGLPPLEPFGAPTGAPQEKPRKKGLFGLKR